METYRDLIMALAKVIIAVAWADHELDEEEIESLKDVVHHLGSTFDMGSQLSGHEWEQLKMYMESPVDQEELDQLVINLQDAIRTDDHKEMVLTALDNVVMSDGEVSDEEQAALEEIKASIDDVGTGVGRMGWAVRKSMGRRSKKAQSTVTLGSSVISANGELDMSGEDLRRLVLAAGLMARVAYVDREVLAEEQQLMEDVMKAYWKASPEASSFVAKVVIDEGTANVDQVRLMREFTEVYDKFERAKFLEVLFGVAISDGAISMEEDREIEEICRGIGLLNKEFVDAKAKFDRTRSSQDE
ncbi:MAG: TerB family tellurite resistance protein [Anaerolineales bacterium]